MGGPHIQPWEEIIIVTAYLSGATAAQAGAVADRSKYGALSVLKRNGIERTKNGEWQRAYEVDEGYFDDLSKEGPAYWLGFLTADGHVSDLGSIVLALQVGDKGHVEKLCDAVSPGRPVQVYEYSNGDGEYAKVDIRSKALALELRGLGLQRRKTHTVEPPSDLPPSSKRHYWRGYFDGDGGISSYESTDARGYTRKRFNATISGNEAMVEGFVSFASELISFSPTVNEGSDGTWRAVYNDDRASCLLRALYSDCSIYLDRKMELATQLAFRP